MNNSIKINTDGWMTTASGQHFHFSDPDPDSIVIEDIAKSLSMSCRYNGHCKYFYSTAQHSILVMYGVQEELTKSDFTPHIFTVEEERQILLTALLHDSAEAYIGDMVAPLKWIMPEFKAIEEKIENVIWDKFNLSHHCGDLIKKHDLRALATEAYFLLPDQGQDWACLEGIERYDIHLDCQNLADAHRSFMAEYKRLTR